MRRQGSKDSCESDVRTNTLIRASATLSEALSIHTDSFLGRVPRINMIIANDCTVLDLSAEYLIGAQCESADSCLLNPTDQDQEVWARNGPS